MNYVTRRTIKIVLLAAIAMLLVVGCAQRGLSEQERLDQFIKDANATPRDFAQLRSNFSTQVSEYSSMNTETWWDGTYFNDAQQPFDVTNETLGGAHPDFSGSTTITGTISNLADSGTTATFVFVANPDPQIADGHLIRAIIIGSGSIEDIRSITDPDPDAGADGDEFEGWELR